MLPKHACVSVQILAINAHNTYYICKTPNSHAVTDKVTLIIETDTEIQSPVNKILHQ